MQAHAGGVGRYAERARQLARRLALEQIPAHRRRAWRRQWVAELEHRFAGKQTGDGAIRFAVGSIAPPRWEVAVYHRKCGISSFPGSSNGSTNARHR